MEPINPTLLESAPRTGLEAIDRILEGLEKGHTGVAAEYCYETQGLCCPIGWLLTGAQRRQIAEAGLNSRPLTVVAERFGRCNIEAMTGMRLEIAQRLQRELDAQPSDEAVKEALLAFRSEYERVLSRSNPALPGQEGQPDSDPLEDDAQDDLQALQDDEGLEPGPGISADAAQAERSASDASLLSPEADEPPSQVPGSLG